MSEKDLTWEFGTWTNEEGQIRMAISYLKEPERVKLRVSITSEFLHKRAMAGINGKLIAGK